jgi:hypothetical protein
MLPLLLLVCGLAAGCASVHEMAPVNATLNRPELVTKEQARQIELSLTDRQIADMLDADVAAKIPAYVGVVRLQETGSSLASGFRHARYSPLELGVISAEELARWERVIAPEKDLKGVRLIPSSAIGSADVSLHRLRAAAAQTGCELLLVYVQADGSVDNFTDAAAMYWTLIGLWTAPGNLYERKTVMQAAIVDCRTGMILATAAGENSMKTAYPAAFEKSAHEKLDSQVPVAALEDLQKHCERAFAQVVTAAQRKASAATNKK